MYLSLMNRSIKHKPTYLEWLLNLLQVGRHKSISEQVAEVHLLNSLGENRRRKTHSDADKLFLPSYNLIHNFLLFGTATPQINTSGFNAFMPHQVSK